MEVLHQVLSRRHQIDNGRHPVAQAVPVVQRKIDAEAPGHRLQVNYRVGRAADGGIGADGVFEGALGLEEFLHAHGAGADRRAEAPDVGARTDVLALVLAVEHGAARERDGRNIAAGGAHEGFFDMVLEARFVLEPQVVEITARKATDAEIKRIEGAYEAMEGAVCGAEEDIEAFNRADIDFHLAILDATHNLILRQVGAVIKVALLASFEMALETEKVTPESLEGHREAAEAIRNRDPKKARASIETIAEILRERVKRRNSSA